MRLTQQLSLALVATATTVFGAFGVRLYEREKDELRSALERSARLTASGLHVSTENALRDGQAVDVRELFDALIREAPGVGALALTPDGQVLGTSNPPEEVLLMLEDATGRARADDRLLVEYLPEESPAWLVLAQSLRSDEEEDIGQLALALPLDSLEADLARTARSVVATVITFVLILGAIGSVLARVYVGRPLERLAEAMRRVRLGDLATGLDYGRSGELEAVSREFNAMLQDLRQTRAELEQESRAKRRLETGLVQANRTITLGQLAASLAHEVGSPLQVVAGRARQLMEPGLPPETQRRSLEIIVGQCDRIAGLVTKVLGVSRRAARAHSDLGFASAARSVVEFVELEARRRSVTISFEVQGELGRGDLDPGAVQQVLLNLLTNALHAAPASSEIRVTLGASTMTTTWGETREVLRLIVEDAGEGMSPEVREHLFEPFFTTRAEQGGSGLGLTVVRSIVDEYGGRIEVHDLAPHGTCFEVFLPLESRRTSPPHHEQSFD